MFDPDFEVRGIKPGDVTCAIMGYDTVADTECLWRAATHGRNVDKATEEEIVVRLTLY